MEARQELAAPPRPRAVRAAPAFPAVHEALARWKELTAPRKVQRNPLTSEWG